MNIEDFAIALDVLASRVRQMSSPLSSDPERFHAQRSVIAHDIAELARGIAPRPSSYACGNRSERRGKQS